MYIDTHTKETIQESICREFNIEDIELKELFIRAEKESKKGIVIDSDKLESVLNKFINRRMSNKDINEILFFHLSRRLNSAPNCVEGNNLFELLTEENAMSIFLKKHEVIFKANNKHLDLFYKDKHVELEEMEDYNIKYLKWRLGHYSNRQDYCFNGFAFKDLLHRNSYTRSLYDGPEFLIALSDLLEEDDIKRDYFESSTYYCLEYIVPIDKIIFDGNDKVGKTDKQKYFLNQILKRLYEYYLYDEINVSDEDNPVIRLDDYDLMQDKYFISKEEITRDMLY